MATFGGGYEAYLEEREVARRQARRHTTTTPDAAPSRSGPAPSGPGWRRASERATQGEGQRQDRPQVPRRADREAGREGAPDRAADRAARRRRRAPQGVAAAVLHRRRPALGRRRTVARAAVVSAGDFGLGPVDLQIDLGDRVADRTERLGQVHAACATARPDRCRTSGVTSAQVSSSARSTRHARVRGDAPRSRIRPRGARLAEADVRTLLAKFGLGADQVTRPASSCHRASARVPRWHCCRPEE